MSRVHPAHVVVALSLFLIVGCNFLSFFGSEQIPTVTPAPTVAPAPSPTPAPTYTPAPIYLHVVAFDHLYLRQGPGMQYAADNEVLNWGDNVIYAEQCAQDATGTQWVYVQFGNKFGWVSQLYVTPTECRPQ